MQVLCLNRFFKQAEKLVLFELAFMAWIEEMIKKQYFEKRRILCREKSA